MKRCDVASDCVADAVTKSIIVIRWPVIMTNISTSIQSWTAIVDNPYSPCKAPALSIHC